MIIKDKCEFEIHRATTTWQFNISPRDGFKLSPKGIRVVNQALLSMPVWFEANQFWGYRGAEEDDPFMAFDQTPEDHEYGFTMFSLDKECLECVAAKVSQDNCWEEGLTAAEWEAYEESNHLEPDHSLCAM